MTLSAIADYWWSWMAPMFWQVCVLALLVGSVDFVLRRWAWPQLRIALWSLVLVKLCVPPTLTTPWSLSVPAPARVSSGAPSWAPSWSRVSLDRGGEPDSRANLPTVLFLIWLGGLAGVTAKVAVRNRRMTGWLRGNPRVPRHVSAALGRATRRLGLRRPPELVLSRSVCSPAVCGIWRPVIVVPAKIVTATHRAEFTRKHLENTFLHELAHIRRGDLWTHALCRALQAAYWFHPLVWIAGRHVRNLREICCDATVADVLRESTAGYRDTLLLHASRLLEAPEPRCGGLGFLTGPANIVARLQFLERRSWQHPKLRRVSTLAASLILGILLLPAASGRQSRPSISTLHASSGAEARRLPPTETLRHEELAREILDSAARGEARGCLQIRYAAMLLASSRQGFETR